MDNYPYQNYPQNASTSPPSRRHPTYRGIRMRAGKWVTEIREPGKTTRIWLGTYPTPEMAATAYDVAAIALRGSEAVINFPEWVQSYPLPTSESASDIRAAASAAAAARAPPQYQTRTGNNNNTNNDVFYGSSSLQFPQFPPNDQNTTQPQPGGQQEFIDEEALFNMPNLLWDMAGGMLVSPPRMMNPPPSNNYDHSPDNNSGGGDNLWGYNYPYKLDQRNNDGHGL